MKVALKAITKPVDDTMTVEDFVAYVARVSNPDNQNNKLTSKKLLKYLRKNKHFSPFEMVSLVIEVNTTRDIGRQILRHRSCHFQEFSQRYADPTKMEFVYREARLQDNKNRQNSIEIDDPELQKEWEAIQYDIISRAKAGYQWAVSKGIAKEQARVVLPEGLTASKMYISGTLRDWYFYCQLRMSNGTQKEHMEIAKACWDIIIQQFPSLAETE
jgi:thymidylate synthase (FAD)